MTFIANKVFYSISLIFIVMTLVWYGQVEHGDGIVWFSLHRSSFLDFFFKQITKVGEAWTYVLLLIVLLFRRFREAILVFALAILVPLISHILKDFFAQSRPKKYFCDTGIFDDIQLVENIVLHTGQSSFPSGHTMSAFAVLGFAAYIFRKNHLASCVLGILAVSVGFSRVYLVQHFLIDVAVGALVGCLIAAFTSWLLLLLSRRKEPWLQKSLLSIRDSKIKV